MLAISSAAGLVPGISAWGLRRPVAGSVRSQNPISTAGRYADSVDIPLTRQELLAMAGGADESGRAGNALLTAHDALGVIGGLLGNVQAVLSAASSHDPSFDTQTDQSRIDSAVWTIDALASSTKFGGQQLLDGTFKVAGVAIPSYSSRELGMDKTAQLDPLATLVSGASNDLASGHLAAAERILTSAMSQVTTTQSQIVERQNSSPAQPPALPPGVSSADLMTTAASELLADPALSAAAVANSSAQNVFALLLG